MAIIGVMAGEAMVGEAMGMVTAPFPALLWHGAQMVVLSPVFCGNHEVTVFGRIIF